VPEARYKPLILGLRVEGLTNVTKEKPTAYLATYSYVNIIELRSAVVAQSVGRFDIIDETVSGLFYNTLVCWTSILVLKEEKSSAEILKLFLFEIFKNFITIARINRREIIHF
jgi:hypothetical protein